VTRPPRFVPNLGEPRSRPSSPVEAASDATELTVQHCTRDGVQAVSLDVFDTLVTRACGRPSDLYLWLGRRLAATGRLSVTPEVFARARERAESVVWHRDGGMDSRVDLVTIHAEVVRSLGLAESSAVELAAAEFTLEKQASRALPAAEYLVGLADDPAGPVVVVASDTYLNGRQVRVLLDRHGLVPVGERVLVSSDLARSKASGRLFAAVQDEVGHRGIAVLHCGDNPHSDVDVPRALGLRAAWLPRGRLNRYEDLLSAASFDTAGLSAAFAGASRLARLAVPAAHAHEAAVRDVAAGVAAPVLVGYVLWILDRAVRHDLRRVAFLARDGQVLSAIARRLVDRLGLDLAVDYLAVSRQSTNLAATYDVTTEETDWVFRDAGHLTPVELLARFDLDPDDVRPHLDVPLPSGPDVTTPALADLLRARVQTHGPVRDLVQERAATRRTLVTDYLDQHGLVGTDPVGIVDFGGVGSQVRAVHQLVGHAGGKPPRIFLVGLDDPAQAGLDVPDSDPDWLVDTETWLYDHRRGRGIRRERGFGTCVQMFCAADHGTVVGYERTDGGVMAILAVERDDAVLDWGLPVLQATVERVVDELVLDEELLDRTADLRSVGTQLVDLFWSAPTEAEAAAWGSFPFEGAQATSSTPEPLAYRYTVRQVVRGFVDGYFPNLGWQHWYEGSLRLSSPVVRTGLQVGEVAFRTLRRVDGPLARRVVGWARGRRP